MTSDSDARDATPFDTDVLDALTTKREVTIETRSRDRWYPTIIWVAVAEGVVYLRSVRGDQGRWYQRAMADPVVRLLFDGRTVTALAVPTPDADSIERASRGFTAKYRSGRSLESMLLPDVLHTTLRLHPER